MKKALFSMVIVCTVIAFTACSTKKQTSKVSEYALLEERYRIEDSIWNAKRAERMRLDSLQFAEEERLDDSITKIATVSRLRREVRELVVLMRRNLSPVVQYGDNGCRTFKRGYVCRTVSGSGGECTLTDFDLGGSLIQADSPWVDGLMDQEANGLGEVDCDYDRADETTYGVLYLRQSSEDRAKSRVAYYKTVQYFKAELKNNKTSL